MKTPWGITAGPDGALWFTNSDNDSAGRITTDGKTMTNYPDPLQSQAPGITAGPDGALWFTNFGSDSIGRITSAGTVTDCITDPGIFRPGPITHTEGALWFGNEDPNGWVARLDPITKQVITCGSIPFPNAIAVQADGAAVWAICYTGEILQLNTDGQVLQRYVGVGSNTYGIAAGPPNAMWFCNAVTSGPISWITTDGSGKVTPYLVPGASNPGSIAEGSDGAMWFTANNGVVGRITTP